MSHNISGVNHTGVAPVSGFNADTTTTVGKHSRPENESYKAAIDQHLESERGGGRTLLADVRQELSELDAAKAQLQVGLSSPIIMEDQKALSAINNAIFLINEMASQLKRVSRELRNLQAKAEVESIEKQASQMLDEAKKTLISRCVEGAMSITAGAVGMGASGYAVGKSMQAVGRYRKLDDISTRFEVGTDHPEVAFASKRIDAEMHHGSNIAMLGQAVGNSLNGVGKVGGGVAEFEAGVIASERKNEEASQKSLEEAKQKSIDSEQTSRDLAQKALSILEELENSRHQSMPSV